MLDDTRKIPYLLIWKNHSDGTVKEAARIAPYYEAAGRGGPDWTGAFEIKRHDGSRDFIPLGQETQGQSALRGWKLSGAHCVAIYVNDHVNCIG